MSTLEVGNNPFFHIYCIKEDVSFSNVHLIFPKQVHIFNVWYTVDPFFSQFLVILLKSAKRISKKCFGSDSSRKSEKNRPGAARCLCANISILWGAKAIKTFNHEKI